VFRVLIAYVVIGFGVAEGAGIFLPALGFPDWTVDLVAWLVVLGLPVALGLAWAFDVVPADGLSGAVTADPDALSHRAQELFVHTLDVPEDNREGFLLAATGSDERLLGEVRALLRAHARQGPLDVPRERVVAPLIEDATSVADLEGESLHHYEILEKLGGGGMGVVYKARDTRLDRIVALKFLSAHLLSDSEAKDRFLVEAQAAASLDHPNLCTIHEIGDTDDGRLYIAMAYYGGETVQRRIARSRVGVEEALDIGAQVSRGLARAADRGIIHRDIKPANLILSEDGTVKIVDFGLAKITGAQLTQAGTRMGTVSYMSPEQTRGDAVDQRTDVWSLGVVLYEMLSGQRPFRGGSDQAVIHAILNQVPTQLDEIEPSLPYGVTAVVARAMRKDAVNRYPDVASMLVDLERLMEDPSSRTALDAAPSLPPEGERRLVTVLACVIGGFETLLETLEAEAVDDELSRLQARVRGVLQDYGGVLNEFSEDKVVALFGVPVTHEDDALRAVRAALELHDPDRAEEDVPVAVELRSAVGSGHVAIRAAGAGERRYRVGGTVVGDVSRLAATAAPGELLILPDLARSVAPFVQTEERAPVRLSSDASAVIPLAVLAESGAEGRVEAQDPEGLTQFVGRVDELNTLMRALEGANSGVGRVVSVVGDAGVGKSRLLLELRTKLNDDGIRYVLGRCRARGGLTPFIPFIDSVRAMLGTARVTSDSAHDLVVERTRSLAPELEIYLPVLLHLLSIESEEFPLPEYLAGEDLRVAIGEALVSVFTLGSRGEPLVVLLEDWHWADGGSRDVLNQLSEMVSAYPLLLVVAARPGQDDEWPPLRGDVHIDLAPLDAGSATEVMRAALGGARVSVELADRITEKTGGNPFFIEELCHTLLETETIVLEGGEATIAGSLDRLAIPDTVQGVLKTRLDRLDPEAREVLRSASVIGRQFGLELLSRVVPSRSRLQGALDGLRAAGHLQRTSLLPEPTYRFKHALTLDVTYDSLLERQRKERHALVGKAVETLYADRLDEFSERLAEHFAIAEDWDRAVEYGFAAAERAAGVWRLQEAVGTLERTREWLDRRGGDETERRATLVRLLLEEERHLETLGQRDRQQIVIDEILTLLPEGPSPERATVLVRQGELLTLLGRPTEAQEALDKAIEVAEQAEAPDVRMTALRAVGHGLWTEGRYAEAQALLTEVVEYDREGAPATLLLRDLLNLGRVLREQGQWDRARAIGEEGQALAESTNSPVDLNYASNYMGHLLKTMGRPEEALAEFEKGSELGTAHPLPIRQTFNLLAAAALHMELGRRTESFAAYDGAIRLARRSGRVDNLAQALTLQGDALMAVGTLAESVVSYEEAVSILRRLGTDGSLGKTMGSLARAYEAEGRDEAVTTWGEVKTLRLELGDKAGALEAAEHEAALHRGDLATGRALHEAVLALAVELDDSATLARTLNRLALLAWRQGDLAEAERHYLAAAAHLRGGDDPASLGVVLNGLGAVLARTARPDEARDALLEALEANREAGEIGQEADSLAALGAALRGAGDLTRAYDWFQQCLEKRRDAGDRPGEGWALHRLAELANEAGTPDRASALAAAALVIARETRDMELEALCTQAGSGDHSESTGSVHQ